MKSKSIFQVDWAFVIQMEHEKCLEMIFLLNAHIVPTLVHATLEAAMSVGRSVGLSVGRSVTFLK